MKRHVHIIYGCLFVVLFFLVVLALMSSSEKLGCDPLSVLSMDKAGNLMGIFVSTFGLVVTVYFVVLTFKARETQKEIETVRGDNESLKKDVEDLKKEKAQLQGVFTNLQSDNKDFESTLNTTRQSAKKTEIDIKKLDEKLEHTKILLPDYSEFLYEIIDVLIATAESNKALERRNVLKLMKARLSYRFPMLETQTRIILLLELAAIGEKQDIRPLEAIIQSENEPDSIKEIAKISLGELKGRGLT